MEAQEISFSDKGLASLKIGEKIDEKIILKEIDTAALDGQIKYDSIATTRSYIYKQVAETYKITGINTFREIYVGLDASDRIMEINIECDQTDLIKIKNLLIGLFGEFDIQTDSGMNGLKTGFGYGWYEPDLAVYLTNKFQSLTIRFIK